VAVLWHDLLVPEDTGDFSGETAAHVAAARWVESLSMEPLTRCYDRSLRRDPSLHGGMRVRLTRREEVSAEVVATGIEDAALQACVARTLSQAERVPASPFVVVLGFCPRHLAACFAGFLPSHRGQSDALASLLRAVEPTMQRCVADHLTEARDVRGGAPLFLATSDGMVTTMSLTNLEALNLSSHARHVAFQCATDALRMRCVDEAGEIEVRESVMVQSPR